MTEHPTRRRRLRGVYKAWIDLGIDGFRIDTVKHVNFEFWEEWSAEIEDYAHAQGKDEFFTFGEVYDADAAKTSPYVRRTDMSSVLDFSFQSAATSYASGNSARGLADLYASDDLYTTPHSSPRRRCRRSSATTTWAASATCWPAPTTRSRATSWRTSSCTSRAASRSSTTATSRASRAPAATRTPARPCSPRRSTSTRTSRWSRASRPGSVDRYGTDAPLYEHIAALADLREEHPALATGAQFERYADDGAGVYAFSRVHRDELVEHLVAANNAAAERTVTFDYAHPGRDPSRRCTARTRPVTADADGAVTLTVPARSAVVLVADRTVGADSAGAVTVVPGTSARPGAAVTGVAPVAAGIDDAWAETSFAWRAVGTDEWHHLGTAEDTSPRVFHDVGPTATPCPTAPSSSTAP